MNNNSKFFFVLFLLIVVFGCKRKAESDYELKTPSHFPAPEFPKTTSFNKDIVELGKMLFYDPILSGDNSISCASCHHPDFAFSDHGKILSEGINGNKGFRNAPPLFNLLWEKNFFRDGGVSDLETQVLTPITADFEMHQTFKILIDKLRKDPVYTSKFKKAFGSDIISGQRVLSAIAQFERTIISADSKYDKWIRKEPGGELSDLELEGFTVFQNKCSSCHKGHLFKDDLFHNNGLDSIFPGFEVFDEPKLGRARITNKAEDIGKYKTPTLRNIELTAPYMHDGRLNDLDMVLNHYSSDIKYSLTLDTLLRDKKNIGIPLTIKEKKAITAFLKTLTDTIFVKNINYRISTSKKN